MRWSCKGQRDWLLSAESLDSFRALTTKVLPLSDLSVALWTDDSSVAAMLAELRQTP